MGYTDQCLLNNEAQVAVLSSVDSGVFLELSVLILIANGQMP